MTVIRIMINGVDHLFFGPLVTIDGDITEIEFLGVTSKASILNAMTQPYRPTKTEVQ
jgi:hypothetical protein